MWGCGGVNTRYTYLASNSARIFAPSKFWLARSSKPVLPNPKPAVSVAALAKAVKAQGRYLRVPLVRILLGGKSQSLTAGPGFRRRYAKYQRTLGFKGSAADGVPGKASLTTLCTRSKACTVTK